jgi:hypothetical protein
MHRLFRFVKVPSERAIAKGSKTINEFSTHVIAEKRKELAGLATEHSDRSEALG